MVELENAVPQFQKPLQQTGRYRSATAWTAEKPVLVIHSLPVLVLMTAAVLVSSLFLFVLSTLQGMAYARMDQKTFAIYRDIFPGELETSLERFDCRPQKNASAPSSVNMSSKMCVIFPQQGSFHIVQVALTQGRVNQMTFFSADLKPEALFAYWGEPDATSRSVNYSSYQLEWRRPQYSVTAIVMESTRIVRMVTLTENP